MFNWALIKSIKITSTNSLTHKILVFISCHYVISRWQIIFLHLATCNRPFRTYLIMRNKGHMRLDYLKSIIYTLWSHQINLQTVKCHNKLLDNLKNLNCIPVVSTLLSWLSIFGLQVVLPEGSGDISVSAPFPVNQWEEVQTFLYKPSSFFV